MITCILLPLSRLLLEYDTVSCHHGLYYLWDFTFSFRRLSSFCCTFSDLLLLAIAYPGLYFFAHSILNHPTSFLEALLVVSLLYFEFSLAFLLYLVKVLIKYSGRDLMVALRLRLCFYWDQYEAFALYFSWAFTFFSQSCHLLKVSGNVLTM